MQIIFATQNPNKLKEIASLMPEGITLTGLDASRFTEELPETGDTLEANALQKARYVWEATRQPCFADDTGLEVRALDGRPGVYSARYAGEQKNADDNIAKVLGELENSSDRSARFRTVIAFVDESGERLFEGVVEGTITPEKRGTKGFGYDPVFVAEGMTKTFAELELEEKNKVSHRKRAFQKLVQFLQGKG